MLDICEIELVEACRIHEKKVYLGMLMRDFHHNLSRALDIGSAAADLLYGVNINYSSSSNTRKNREHKNKQERIESIKVHRSS